MLHIFIVNPYAGKKTFADDLRSKLEKIDNLNYFVFNTRYAGNEIDIIHMIQDTFAGERIRYYCCGGSGTMHNIMNGFDHLSDVEIAWYPCGATNDFLKLFGEQQALFHSIDALIDGVVMPVDYIQTSQGVAINSVSVGLDSIALQKKEQYKLINSFSETAPLNIGIVYALAFSKTVEYEIVVNNEFITNSVSELFFGNGNIMGGNLHFFEDAELNSGIGQYRVISETGIRAMKILNGGLRKKNFEMLDANSKHGESTFIRIRRKDGASFVVNQDGELMKEAEEWEAHIVPSGLNLVVPKGVHLNGR